MRSPDVIVIGAGVAGLRAAVELAARGARVTVLEARSVLGGRATAFHDPRTGERVDNGQHVLLGCYNETFSFLRQIGTEDRVRVQPNLEVDFVDRRGVRSQLRLPALPAPINFLAGLLDWTALNWHDRVAAVRLAQPIRIAQSELSARAKGVAPTRIAASPGETVEEWLINNGQTARIREMLWEPLALAALNQSVRSAAAPPFAAVLAQMFGGGPRDASLALPLCPLDELYAEPSRRFIESRGGDVRIGSPARIHLQHGQAMHIEARGVRILAGAIVVAVPWYAMPDLFYGDTAPVDALRRAAADTLASPIASVNLWLDRRVLQTPFLGLPGRVMQWVFDKEQMFESGSSHLTLVSSGADEVMAVAERRAHRAGAARTAGGAARRTRRQGSARVCRARASRDIFDRARPAEAARHGNGRGRSGARG